MICKECGEEKKGRYKDICEKCYKSPLKICKKCGKNRIHKAYGLCEKCYKSPLKICKKCGEKRKIIANGLCRNCYKPLFIICKKCGKEKEHMAKGLCGKCYKSPLKICKKCGEKQIHTSKELCYRCYNKQYKPPLKICKKCGKKRQFVTKKLCWDCWSKVKRKTDENYRLRCNLRSTSLQQIQSHGGKKYYSTMKLHDCTFQELIKYLNKTGPEGITIKDIAQFGYHIDHIIPLSSFDLTKPEEQLKAFHYTNLQLLWWEENLQKGAKMDWLKNDM